MRFELFQHPFSPNCMAVQMTALELEQPLEKTFVDVGGGAQQSPQFLALNPNGFVPVLRDGAFVLWETIPIMQYIASQSKDSPMWPAAAQARADISRWQNWSAAHWIPALQPFVFENIFKRLKGLGDADLERLSVAKASIARFGKVLEDQLAGRPWVVGDAFTLADISLSTYLVYAERAAMPLDNLPNIRRWLAAIEKRPSWISERPSLPA